MAGKRAMVVLAMCILWTAGAMRPTSAQELLTDSDMSSITGCEEANCWDCAYFLCPFDPPENCVAHDGFCRIVIPLYVYMVVPVVEGRTGASAMGAGYCSWVYAYEFNAPCVCNQDTFIAGDGQHLDFANDCEVTDEYCGKA